MKIKRILQKALGGRGFSREHTKDVVIVSANNNLDGAYSHGANRFPRAVECSDKGEINSGAITSCKSSMGVVERWNGHKGLGPLDAKLAMDRAVELAKEYDVDVVALGNNSHWMRGGGHGWQVVDEGCTGIYWSDTVPNMSAWGGKDRKIGNNLFITSIPRDSGKHAIIDCAISQFLYGRIEGTELEGQQLPVPGGYDTKGNLTADPAEIEKTWRVLPMGYWKGGDISIAPDLITTTLTSGSSASKIGTFGDGVGLSRIMIAIDPLRLSAPKGADFIVDETLTDIKSSEPIREGAEVYYSGELEPIVRENNTRDEILIIDEVQEALNNLKCQKVAFKSNIEERFNSWNISQEY